MLYINEDLRLWVVDNDVTRDDDGIMYIKTKQR